MAKIHIAYCNSRLTPLSHLISKGKEPSRYFSNEPSELNKKFGAPYTFVADVHLGLHVGPLTIGVGTVSDSVPCLWTLFYKPGCLIGPQFGRG